MKNYSKNELHDLLVKTSQPILEEMVKDVVEKFNDGGIINTPQMVRELFIAQHFGTVKIIEDVLFKILND